MKSPFLEVQSISTSMGQQSPSAVTKWVSASPQSALGAPAMGTVELECDLVIVWIRDGGCSQDKVRMSPSTATPIPALNLSVVTWL